MVRSASFSLFSSDNAREDPRKGKRRGSRERPERISQLALPAEAADDLLRRTDLLYRLLRLIGATRAADKQPVGVDAVRRAGEQRHIIAVPGGQQAVHPVGLHNGDVIDGVSQPLAENIQTEFVPDLEPVEVRKQQRARQSAVARQHAVGPRTADGQTRSREVSHALLEHVLARAVVDRQADGDFRDLQIAHHAAAVRVEQGPVQVRIETLDARKIAADEPVLPPLVPEVAERGIEQHAEPDKENKRDRDRREQTSFFLLFQARLPLLRARSPSTSASAATAASPAAAQSS